ncbi:hypothetical protein KLMIMMO078B4_19965 [Klebsiella michiganensis]|nr:hypothetical protein SFB9_0248 [Klebsiella michiganensis]
MCWDKCPQDSTQTHQEKRYRVRFAQDRLLFYYQNCKKTLVFHYQEYTTPYTPTPPTTSPPGLHPELKTTA